MYLNKYYTTEKISNITDSNLTINKFINLFISKFTDKKYIDAINYSKCYCCYKNFNCTYNKEIMNIIYETIN